ncbi:helix-turn-helix domain-containing protein [Jiangella muralis]|uniref:helix-turn-helix domain-containing protein n=1 Tax=Jiangella muralis TaxID=702383 RepID=UPI001969B8D5|nr:helix-turn-helix transcriptional regulator [Jiangella muralis]
MTSRDHSIWRIGQEVSLRHSAAPWTIHRFYVAQVRYVHLRQPVRPGIFTNLRVRDDVLRAHQRALGRDASRDARTPATVFAARLRELRVEHGLSQDELARLARMHVSYLGRIESGRVNVGLDIVWNLAVCLGVRPSEFLP